MPGIVGIVTNMPREWAEPQLSKMLGIVRHESFYATGTFTDDRNGVYCGWTVQDKSFSDPMPVRNEKGDVVLVFSGEEYPEPGASASLRAKGHQFDPENASYLVHVYEEDPANFPLSLNGRFHGLVVDSARSVVKLFNDRFGMHRLYYHQSKEAFYFAVEAKAILAVRPELRSIDMQSLGEYVSCGCVLDNRSLFKDIRVLPPGSAWTFKGGVLEKKGNHFDPREWEQQSALEPEPYHLEMRRSFSENLPKYLKAQQPLGMSLTGGLDTRMVMAWQKFAPGTFPCYTYGGAYRECRDVVVARQVATLCKQTHQAITVDGNFLSRFAHYAQRSVYLTDGCTDVYRAPDLYLSERARQIAPIRITGLYGDEVLRHSRAFKPSAAIPGLYSQSFLPHVDAARNTYNNVLQCHPTSFALFRQATWHHFGILSLEQTQLAVRTPYLDNDFLRTVYRAPASAVENNNLRVQLIGDGSPTLQALRTDRGFGGNSNYLVSSASRAYQEFTFKAEYAYDYGMPQWVARVDHAFSPLHLERLFLGRHKLYHFRVWYRDILNKYVRDMLLDSKSLSRPYIERKGVENVVEGHLSGKQNFTSELHRLLTLELIHQLFIEAT
jgi:asparagine synthase (glutamine-hydrolysing)